MPAPDMKLVFVGVEPRALCEQLEDPARNGGKDTAALPAHLDTSLVAWGWSPGFGHARRCRPRAQRSSVLGRRGLERARRAHDRHFVS